MFRTCILVALAGIPTVSCSKATESKRPASETSAAATPNAAETSPESLDGLWSGSWGGGVDGEVVMQPVLAEMFLRGDQIELHGFRNVESLVGTVRIDGDKKRLQISPAAAEGQAPPAAIEFAYVLAGDDLTLADAEGVPTLLTRHSTIRDPPLANCQVSLVTATGINEHGELVVTEFTTLLAGRGNDVYYKPSSRTLVVEKILLLDEEGLKDISAEDARGLLREETPVAVVFRESGELYSTSTLWHPQAGPPPPDSEAMQRMMLRMLRPGTLVFIAPASQFHPPR